MKFSIIKQDIKHKIVISQYFEIYLYIKIYGNVDYNNFGLQIHKNMSQQNKATEMSLKVCNKLTF